MSNAIIQAVLREAQKRVFGYVFKAVELAGMWAVGHWWNWGG
jgi:hypothetical protein